MKEFYVDDIKIGGIEPLVIPEIGINHEGSLEVAKEMVLSASRAGARIIKHQTHVVEDEMCGAAKKVIPGNSTDSIYEIMNRCALSEEEEAALKEYTESLGMVFLSTPFSRAAVDRLQRLNVKAFKVGSGEMNNYPLIEYMADLGKPMIVSTGMNNISSIKKTVAILERNHVSYALMHTTNLYPTEPSQVRLAAMRQMMEEFCGIPIGLSDHTINNNACVAAIALGAKIVERHYTDNKKRTGPDIVCSMDEMDLRELIGAAHEIPQMLGGKKETIPAEKVTRDFAFASVVSISPIKAGEAFSKDNIWVKRPGNGEISAEEFGNVLGKLATVDIAEDVQIDWDMVQ